LGRAAIGRAVYFARSLDDRLLLRGQNAMFTGLDRISVLPLKADSARSCGRALAHDPEKWAPFAERIMRKQQPKARLLFDLTQSRFSATSELHHKTWSASSSKSLSPMDLCDVRDRFRRHGKKSEA
jgi:hypothetical protein